MSERVKLLITINAGIHGLLILGGVLVCLTPTHEPLWWPFAVWGACFAISTPILLLRFRKDLK